MYNSVIDASLPQHTLHKLVFQSDDRARIQKQFSRGNIDCPVHYTRLVNDESLYRRDQPFPVSDRYKQTSFTVPNQHTLTDAEVERIAKVLQ